MAVPFQIPVVITPVFAVTISPLNEITPVKAPKDKVIAEVVVGVASTPETP